MAAVKAVSKGALRTIPKHWKEFPEVVESAIETIVDEFVSPTLKKYSRDVLKSVVLERKTIKDALSKAPKHMAALESHDNNESHLCTLVRPPADGGRSSKRLGEPSFAASSPV
ncbi:hypothetical protein AAVH_09668 [Aphelenchoides avenae]|nr:hypothetical protein AAVH_09668 [Aphelenchus avenae]